MKTEFVRKFLVRNPPIIKCNRNSFGYLGCENLERSRFMHFLQRPHEILGSLQETCAVLVMYRVTLIPVDWWRETFAIIPFSV